MSDYYEVDGQSTGTSSLMIYSAHKQTTSARLEMYDIFTVFLKITNRTQDYVLKLDHQEMIVMREVLNNWHKNNKSKEK